MNLSPLVQEVYTATLNMTTVMIAPLFFAKTAWTQMTMGSIDDHFDNIKTTVMCVITLLALQNMLPLLAEIPSFLSTSFSENVNLVDSELNKKKNAESLIGKAAEEISATTTVVLYTVLNGVTSALTFLINALVQIVFVTLAAIAPVIVIASMMMNLGVGVKILMSVFVLLSSWSIAISAISMYYIKMGEKPDSAMGPVMGLLVAEFLKFLVGFVNALLFMKAGPAANVTKLMSMAKSGLQGRGGGYANNVASFVSAEMKSNTKMDSPTLAPMATRNAEQEMRASGMTGATGVQSEASGNGMSARSFNNSAGNSSAGYGGGLMGSSGGGSSGSFSTEGLKSTAPSDYAFNPSDTQRNEAAGMSVDPKSGAVTDVSGNYYKGAEYKSNAGARLAFSRDSDNMAKMSAGQIQAQATKSGGFSNRDRAIDSGAQASNPSQGITSRHAGHFAKSHGQAANNFSNALNSSGRNNGNNKERDLIQPQQQNKDPLLEQSEDSAQEIGHMQKKKGRKP